MQKEIFNTQGDTERSERSKRLSQVEKKQVPKPLNYSMCGKFKEQQGRQCARNRMSEGKKSSQRENMGSDHEEYYVSATLPE